MTDQEQIAVIDELVLRYLETEFPLDEQDNERNDPFQNLRAQTTKAVHEVFTGFRAFVAATLMQDASQMRDQHD